MTAPGPSSRSSRQARRHASRAPSSDWSPVWAGQEAEAAIIAGSLEALGLATRALQSSSVSAGHLGAVAGRSTVFVRGSEAPRARRLLADRGEGPYIVEASAKSPVEDNWRMITRLALVTAAVAVAIVIYAGLRSL